MPVVYVSGLIPATPSRVFQAWFDAVEHRAFTGGRETEIRMTERSNYRLLGGAASGKVLSFERNRRILLSFRGQDFQKKHKTSQLEVGLRRRRSTQTEITFTHEDVPEDLVRTYEGLWLDAYVLPMRRYFQILDEDAKARQTTPS